MLYYSIFWCATLLFVQFVQGTVLKAAFFCAGILSQSGNESLQQQLTSKYQSGFELQTWSDLPHGSGLGTSSILAGTIIAALWRVVGKVPNVDAVIHAVGHLFNETLRCRRIHQYCSRMYLMLSFSTEDFPVASLFASSSSPS